MYTVTLDNIRYTIINAQDQRVNETNEYASVYNQYIQLCGYHVGHVQLLQDGKMIEQRMPTDQKNVLSSFVWASEM